MATKRAGASKKGAAKKSTTKKSTTKKASAGKGATKAAAIPINFKCIEACVLRYHRCLQKGVDQATCQKRLVRCISNCAIGIFPTAED